MAGPRRNEKTIRGGWDYRSNTPCPLNHKPPEQNDLHSRVQYVAEPRQLPGTNAGYRMGG